MMETFEITTSGAIIFDNVVITVMMFAYTRGLILITMHILTNTLIYIRITVALIELN